MMVIGFLSLATYLDSTVPRVYREMSLVFPTGNSAKIFDAALQFFILSVSSTLLFMLSDYLCNICGECISSQLRLDLFTALQKMPFWFFTHKHSGHFTALFNNQLHGAHNGITKTIPRIVTNILAVLMSSIQLFKSDWRVASMVLVVLPIFVTLTQYLQKRTEASQKQAHDLKSEMNDRLKYAFSTPAMLALKNFELEDKFRLDFQQRSEQIQSTQAKLSYEQDIYGRLVGLIFAVAISLVYGLVGGLFVFVHQDMGLVVQTVTSISKLSGPIISLGNIRIDLSSTFVCFNIIFEHMAESEMYEKDNQKRFANPLRPTRLNHWPGDIKVSNLSFTYPDTSTKEYIHNLRTSDAKNFPVLHNIELEIKQGSKVAIIGPNGSGKTTLAYLLAGLYHCDTGSIFVGKYDYKDLEESSFRKLVGILDQHPWFLQDSIHANLTLGKPDASDEEIRNICILSKILKFIRSLPQEFNTMIGENAFRLSGGERQRLALARLLLKNPQLLILDEFNSHLDLRTEVDIFDAIVDNFPKATIVVITHKFSTLKKMDKIVVLENGRIREEGSHEELMKKAGYYKELILDHQNYL